MPCCRVRSYGCQARRGAWLYGGCIPGFSGTHSQDRTLDEHNEKLKEVVAMLLEGGKTAMASEFVDVQTVAVRG